MGNPECGRAKSKSWLNDNWEEIKIAASSEFKVKGTILAEAAIAQSFCFENFKENNFYLESVQFLNFDIDEDREIVGICWRGNFDKEGILFILNKQNDEYKSVLEKEGKISQRYYTFRGLGIEDIDGDGINEITYEEVGWYGGGGFSYLHLNSPKHNEWFWRNDWWKIDIESGEKKEGTSFSPNIDLEEYKVFKEFLLK